MGPGQCLQGSRSVATSAAFQAKSWSFTKHCSHAHLTELAESFFCFEQFASFSPHCPPAPMMLLSLQQILKLCPKKKSSSTYTFCKSVGLLGMQFHLFENECKSSAPGCPGGVWQGKGEGGRGLCELALGERFCQG